MQRNAKVCKSAFLPEECLSEAKLSTASYALLAKTKFVVKTKATHAHTHTHTRLPSLSSPEAAELNSFVTCWDKDVHRQCSALRESQPQGQHPQRSLPGGGRRLIKREITFATENHPQPVRKHMVKAGHQYGRQFNPSLPQAKIRISVPCMCISSNSWLFWDGLVQYIMTTLKCLRNSPEKCKRKKKRGLKLLQNRKPFLVNSPKQLLEPKKKKITHF